MTMIHYKFDLESVSFETLYEHLHRQSQKPDSESVVATMSLVWLKNKRDELEQAENKH